MSSYLNELNETQRQAAMHVDGPALVIAVPGAGKTRVLTYRIAYLLEQGVPPDSILALTFTNKAAKEMKERISKIASARANQIWAGTFHSIFARILRTEAPLIDFPSDFSIYDTTDAKKVLAKLVESQNLDPKVYTPSALYFRISNAKNNLISPELYRSNNDYLVADKNKKIPYAYKIYDLYVRKCQRAGAMDFDDLLYLMHELLRRNPENVLEKYRHKFKYVLVDEFQDTNPLQYAIIQYLVKYAGSKNNIFVVGDDAQSIYGFRGATIQNILDFERDYPTMKIFKLEQNYRSTNHIVQAANNVISYNKRQFKKNIHAEKSGGRPIKVIRGTTEKDEAKNVVESIIDHRHRFQLKYEDIAILYRTNAQSRVFEEILKGYRLPYKIYGGMPFYERKEIKDVLAYLRVVVNPKDEEAIERIINYPTRGIGEGTISALVEEAEKRSIPLWDMLKKSHEVGNLTSRAIPHIRNFVLLIEMFRLELNNKNASELARYIVKHTGISEEIAEEKTSEAQERLNNIETLLSGIDDFVKNDEIMIYETSISDKSLSTYLQNVMLQTDTDEKDPNANDKVKLMSVHHAKGLEFPAVFIVGMEENIFPSVMALKSENFRDALDEERRLFYVAITRAENFLTISYASSRYRFGEQVRNNSSRFIDEIEPKWLELSESAQQNTSASSSSVRGKGIPPPKNVVSNQNIAPKNQIVFKPSPINKIAVGQTIFHERNGKGKIISIDGTFDGITDNRIATILFFDGVGEKRIVIRATKLMIIA